MPLRYGFFMLESDSKKLKKVVELRKCLYYN